MTSSKKFSVFILGLGKIGFNQSSLNDGESITTHSETFFHNNNFEIIGGLDSNLDRTRKFEKMYKVKTFNSFKSMPSSFNCDLVVISTPTLTHSKVFTSVIKKINCKAILCEKPLSQDYELSKKMVAACDNLDIKLFANFQRPTNPGYINLRNQINKKLLKKPFRGFGFYSGEYLNIGSHFVNLFDFLLGPRIDLKITDLDSENSCRDLKLIYKDGIIDICKSPTKKADYYDFYINFKNMIVRINPIKGEITYTSISEGKSSSKTVYLDELTYFQYIPDHIYKMFNGMNHNLTSGELSLNIFPEHK